MRGGWVGGWVGGGRGGRRAGKPLDLRAARDLEEGQPGRAPRAVRASAVADRRLGDLEA
jgi:hypothetical protein